MIVHINVVYWFFLFQHGSVNLTALCVMRIKSMNPSSQKSDLGIQLKKHRIDRMIQCCC